MMASNSGNFAMYVNCNDLDIKPVNKSYQELFGLKLEPSLVSIFLKSENPNPPHHSITLLFNFSVVLHWTLSVGSRELSSG